jgi:salicylate hydroxylase
LRGRYILVLARGAGRDRVAAFTNFRRIRIPRVHGVQRLSLSNARLKHMRDSLAQKESIASGKSSVHGSADWVWSYDPVFEWDNEPFVPAAYAA